MRHLLLDRDGVLNVEHPSGWVTDPADWIWQPGALDALVRLSKARRVSVVTNQSVVGRGLATLDAIHRVHHRMLTEAAAAGAQIHDVVVCPHAPAEGCRCRKPEPGMLLEALAASGTPAQDALFVGDSATDLQAAARAGVPARLVLTGKGRHTSASTGVTGLRDLSAVADLLAEPSIP